MKNKLPFLGLGTVICGWLLVHPFMDVTTHLSNPNHASVTDNANLAHFHLVKEDKKPSAPSQSDEEIEAAAAAAEAKAKADGAKADAALHEAQSAGAKADADFAEDLRKSTIELNNIGANVSEEEMEWRNLQKSLSSTQNSIEVLQEKTSASQWRKIQDRLTLASQIIESRLAYLRKADSSKYTNRSLIEIVRDANRVVSHLRASQALLVQLQGNLGPDKELLQAVEVAKNNIDSTLGLSQQVLGQSQPAVPSESNIKALLERANRLVADQKDLHEQSEQTASSIKNNKADLDKDKNESQELIDRIQKLSKGLDNPKGSKSPRPHKGSYSGKNYYFPTKTGYKFCASTLSRLQDRVTRTNAAWEAAKQRELSALQYELSLVQQRTKVKNEHQGALAHQRELQKQVSDAMVAVALAEAELQAAVKKCDIEAAFNNLTSKNKILVDLKARLSEAVAITYIKKLLLDDFHKRYDVVIAKAHKASALASKATLSAEVAYLKAVVALAKFKEKHPGIRDT